LNRSGPPQDYEVLSGGTGKEIYYRQERFAIEDLLGEHADIEHSVSLDSRVGVIINYGINGVAFSLQGNAPSQDDIVEDFRVKIGHDVVYQGRASVRYCRPEANGTVTIGVVLRDGILDTDAMVMAKNRELSAKTAESLSCTLQAGVSREYKEVMADLVLLLSSYRKLLDSQEAAVQSLSAPAVRVRAESEVLNVAVAEFGTEYDRCRRRCNKLTIELSGETKRAYRHYTESVLHPYLLSAPLPHHCYHKPLGYPGDYVLMSYLYDPVPRGKSLYDKLMHQVAVREEPMAIGVQRRKDFLLDQIRTVVATGRNHAAQSCRILSLACGPAQEVLEFLTERNDDRRPVEFTLIDQDQRSLAHANSCLSRMVIPGSTNVVVRYLYLGFRQLIGQADAFDALSKQDLIYAAGLFDYIKTPTAQRLVRRLFAKLSDKGRLVIGNFRRPNDAKWCLEYWMDWHLIYRDRDEMSSLAAYIDEEHRVELQTDASGYTNMLMISRG
jgi:extracellular factor (EF) 3-hydroxypalmitic acid methyl ester biosynthesis protein